MADVLQSLTVVIPAFNEARRIGATLGTMLPWLQQHAPGAQVIVVDDGSADATCEVVAEMAAALPQLRLEKLGRNRGKGAAVRRGVELAQSEWILFSDADLSTPIEELHKLREAIVAGSDIAIASRALPTSHVARRQPAYRERMGRTFNGFVRALALPGFADTQCGFKLFRADAAKRCFARMTIERFAFDVEVLFIARKLGYRIAEVGVAWHNDEHSTVHPISDASKMLADVARIRYRHRGIA